MTINTGKMISDIDQASAAFEGLAAIIAQYRRSLIENGVPKGVADTVAINTSNTLIGAIAGQLTPPSDNKNE